MTLRQKTCESQATAFTCAVSTLMPGPRLHNCAAHRLLTPTHVAHPGKGAVGKAGLHTLGERSGNVFQNVVIPGGSGFVGQ